ncbi:MAG: hypothetical protein HGA45_25580 [Chloroflexales bacterium]|nr:hypothetical protein [Chloroflexales bacterium]
MRRLLCFGAMLALVLLAGAPAAATAQGTALPPLRLITSARFEHVITRDGQVILVGQGYKESRGRIYMVLKNVDGSDRTTELVLYDGAAYVRQNDEREWRPTNPGAFQALVPTADLLLLFDGPLSSLGPATIGGSATEHYQIWGDGEISDPAQPGFIKVDFFVGTQNRYLYQFQLERTARGPGGGTQVAGLTVRYFDHDDPTLIVYPPR